MLISIIVICGVIIAVAKPARLFTPAMLFFRVNGL